MLILLKCFVYTAYQSVRGMVELDRFDSPHIRHSVLGLVVLQAQLQVRRFCCRSIRRTIPHHVGSRRQLDNHRSVHRQRR